MTHTYDLIASFTYISFTIVNSVGKKVAVLKVSVKSLVFGGADVPSWMLLLLLFFGLGILLAVLKHILAWVLGL